MPGVGALPASVPWSKHVEDGGLAQVQHSRIVGAMLDAACERGGGNVTIAHVVERSGVSRRTFYELFEDRDDCLLAAFEQALAYAVECVRPAFEAQKGWREQIRAALIALLSLFEQERTVGRMLINESSSGGSKTLQRRKEILVTVIGVVAAGAGEAGKARVSSPLTAEGVVGGALSVVGSRLAQQKGSLLELASPLMSMIVLPYLGPAAARKELERSVPASVVGRRRRGRQLLKDPFKDHGLRLTYRTVRVLVAVAEHPGASNRLIANTADIADQGQISKLLTRLERSGMVTNACLVPDRGSPNSWTLTDSGQRVVSTIQAHSEGQHPGGNER